MAARTGLPLARVGEVEGAQAPDERPTLEQLTGVLVRDHPELTARLQEEAAGYLARPPATWGTPLEVEISDLEAGQLRALGYVIR